MTDYDAQESSALDRLMAERMGWYYDRQHGGWRDGTHKWLGVTLWLPTRNPNDDRRVVEWMLAVPRMFEFVLRQLPGCNPRACFLRPGAREVYGDYAYGESVGRAVVIAALRATDGEGE